MRRSQTLPKAAGIVQPILYVHIFIRSKSFLLKIVAACTPHLNPMLMIQTLNFRCAQKQNKRKFICASNYWRYTIHTKGETNYYAFQVKSIRKRFHLPRRWWKRNYHSSLSVSMVRSRYALVFAVLAVSLLISFGARMRARINATKR